MSFLAKFTPWLGIVTSLLLTAGFYSSLPIQNPLDIFSDVNLQPDRAGIYCYIEGGIAAGGFLISSLLTFVRTYRTTSFRWQARISGMFYVAFMATSITFCLLRLINLGKVDFAIKDQGCKNPALDGNPFERAARYGNVTIVTKSDCQFNAFNSEAIVTSGDHVLDWSDHDTFDQSQRNVMLQAANGVLADADKLDLDTLPYYHEYWYWGCSEICTDRYDLNQFWMWLSIGSAASNVILCVLLFVLAGENSEIASVEEKQALVQTSSSVVPDFKSDARSSGSSSSLSFRL